jgi:hypothetical protein
MILVWIACRPNRATHASIWRDRGCRRLWHAKRSAFVSGFAAALTAAAFTESGPGIVNPETASVGAKSRRAFLKNDACESRACERGDV